MNVLKNIIIVLTLAFSANVALAHGNHGDVMPITQTEATTASNNILQSQINRKVLDASWGSSPAPVTTLKKLKTASLWETVYVNDKEKDASKKNFYIYFDEMGSYVGGSHVPRVE